MKHLCLYCGGKGYSYHPIDAIYSYDDLDRCNHCHGSGYSEELSMSAIGLITALGALGAMIILGFAGWLS